MVGARGGLTPEETAEARAFLRLKGCPGFGERAIRHLVDVHGSGQGALAAAMAQGQLWDLGRAEHDLTSWLRGGMDLVSLTSPRYPESLRALSDPPPLLFLRGQARLLVSPCVAIVGSRRATEGGRRTAETLGARLASAGVTVVSGMALGIDGAAHRGALNGGGNTVAVLGSGLEVVHPPSHRSLFRRIASAGLVVSEFLPSETALPFNFPKRNRIIAALAEAVIVVEAGERSGALITVEHALDLGKDILVVPGSVENPQCRGSNCLLRDGARALPDPDAVLDELPEVAAMGAAAVQSAADGAPEGPPVPQELLAVWKALSREASTLEEVARRASITPGEALAGLSSLELDGLAVQRPGLRFQRR
jgi:DNA processing protein